MLRAGEDIPEWCLTSPPQKLLQFTLLLGLDKLSLLCGSGLLSSAWWMSSAKARGALAALRPTAWLASCTAMQSRSSQLPWQLDLTVEEKVRRRTNWSATKMRRMRQRLISEL